MPKIASDFKSNPEIAAISTLLFNRFRIDSAAILQSALRFQSASDFAAILLRCDCDFAIWVANLAALV